MTDKATDQEIADFLTRYIDNPCIDPKTGMGIRSFYVREAERVIMTFTDPIAEKTLREAIDRDFISYLSS